MIFQITGAIILNGLIYSLIGTILIIVLKKFIGKLKSTEWSSKKAFTRTIDFFKYLCFIIKFKNIGDFLLHPYIKRLFAINLGLYLSSFLLWVFYFSLTNGSYQLLISLIMAFFSWCLFIFIFFLLYY